MKEGFPSQNKKAGTPPCGLLTSMSLQGHLLISPPPATEHTRTSVISVDQTLLLVSS